MTFPMYCKVIYCRLTNFSPLFQLVEYFQAQNFACSKLCSVCCDYLPCSNFRLVKQGLATGGIRENENLAQKSIL